MICASNLMTFLLNYSMKPVLPWFLRKEKKETPGISDVKWVLG